MLKINVLIVNFLLFSSLGGCAAHLDRKFWVNAYDGPPLPPANLAVIDIYKNRSEEHFLIDGRSYPDSTTNEQFRTYYTVLPGHHRIDYLKGFRGLGLLSGYCETYMEAGHRYVLVNVSKSTGFLKKRIDGTYLLDFDKSDKMKKIECNQ